jgi:hypothetical protein
VARPAAGRCCVRFLAIGTSSRIETADLFYANGFWSGMDWEI